MSTAKLVKIVVLVLLLIPAGLFFGMACQNIKPQGGDTQHTEYIAAYQTT